MVKDTFPTELLQLYIYQKKLTFFPSHHFMAHYKSHHFILIRPYFRYILLVFGILILMSVQIFSFLLILTIVLFVTS